MPPTTATRASTRPSRNGTGAAIAGIEPALPEVGRPPPAVGPGLVPRPRLVDRLLESADAPLVLVVAPAGFGKTALLSEWAGRDPRQFEWVAPGDDGTDSEGLTAAVARALEPRGGCGLEDELAATPLGAGVRPRAVRARARRTRPSVLVVDDVHALRTRRSLRDLAAVVERLPRGSQLVLASRTEPALLVGRLRAHREVLELRAADLAMTRSEAGALLRAAAST